MERTKDSYLVSVIVPTYNEAGNIEATIRKVSGMLSDNQINGEIIVVDDNSPDGTPEIASRLSDTCPVRVFVRSNERGLATAVKRGFELARGDICLVIDADLSHPLDKIPEMIHPILQGNCDMTVGSRYIARGGCEGWSLRRRLIRKVSGFLARGVTNLSDPTTGFMAIKRSLLDGLNLDPVGWKIVLEVIVRAKPRVIEIPIIFVDRQKGESKLNVKAQMEYLLHLWKLYSFKYDIVFQFIKFCLVGLSGLVVDTAILVGLVEILSFDPRFAAVFSFSGAASWNYLLNRILTFKDGRYTKKIYSYVSFVIICLMGLGIRIGVMQLLLEYVGMGKGRLYILASILGIFSATIFNNLIVLKDENRISPD